MNMVSLLDDSPGEEIAVLILILAATTVVAAPAQKAEAPCPATVILVSKTVGPDTRRQGRNPLPRDKTEADGPAVLMPACKTEQRKKTDYPLA
jgi:hypothetical protein